MHVPSGDGYSVKQVIETCEKITGKKIPSIEKPRRPGDPPQLVADASAARDRLGFVPTRSDLRVLLEDALRSRR